MSNTITPEPAETFAADMAKCMLSKSAKVQLLGANEAIAIVKPRIFNDGLDARGLRLGPYSVGYANTRRKAGRQTFNKDLQFTGVLFNAVTVFEQQGNPVAGVTPTSRADGGPRNDQLAVLIEENEGKDIFALGRNELKKVDSAVDKLISQQLQECFDKL